MGGGVSIGREVGGVPVHGHVDAAPQVHVECRTVRVFGVPWGWGLVIACAIFGTMHILNPFNPFLGRFALNWQWGVSAAFGGLIFAFVREKTGSIVAPALLHGLPQAIASLM